MQFSGITATIVTINFQNFFITSVTGNNNSAFSLQPLVTCVWLISLRIMYSRYTHVVACSIISLLFNGWIVFHCMYIPHFVCRGTKVSRVDYTKQLILHFNTSNCSAKENYEKMQFLNIPTKKNYFPNFEYPY